MKPEPVPSDSGAAAGKMAERTAPETALTEWLLRTFALLACGIAVSRLGVAWWHEPYRVTVLLLLVTELYSLGLLLLARRARVRDMSAAAIAATTFAMFYYTLLQAEGTARLIPESIGVAMQVAGLLFQMAAKITLGRSFGLLPAMRTVVATGPYRWVRHPIYLAYLIGHLGFLGANFSAANLVVLTTLYAAQLYRIRSEEAVLSLDPAYCDYQRRVRWRLVPGVY